MTKPIYGYKAENEKKTAKTAIRNKKISWKDSVEICRYITRKNLNTAIKHLSEVINMKRIIPYKRYIKDLAHKKGKSMTSGKYPIKTSKIFIKMLNNLKSNAESKGLDTENMIIINAQANKGVTHYRGARMFGRRHSKSSNINIIVEEKLV